MGMTTMFDPLSLLRYPVFDSDDVELGQVAGIYLDRATANPEWAAVRMVDGGIIVVPLADANVDEDSLAIPFTQRQVRGAPCQRDELVRELSEDEEAELYRYYREGGAQAGGAARQMAGEVASAAKVQRQRVATAAKDQGRQVAQSTAGQATEVARTAKEQAADVAEQASAQARGLLEETRSRVEEQATTGADKVAANLRRIGEEAMALAEGRPEEASMVRGYVERAGGMFLQAAERAQEVAEDVQSRGLGGLLADAQRFIRSHPGAFLFGAAVAGVAAGRAARSASGQDDGASEQAQQEDQGEAMALPVRATRSRSTERRGTTTGGR